MKLKRAAFPFWAFEKQKENELLTILSNAVIAQHETLKAFGEKVTEEEFTLEDYNSIIEISFDSIAGDCIRKIAECSAEYVSGLKKKYLGIELIEDGVTTAETDDRYDEIARVMLKHKDDLLFTKDLRTDREMKVYEKSKFLWDLVDLSYTMECEPEEWGALQLERYINQERK